MTFNPTPTINSKSITAKCRKKKKPTLADYPPELRGLPNNRWGGHQAQSLRGFKGNTYGPAGPVRQFTEVERRKVEDDMRERGEI
jgi:hypothetical protein